MRSAKVGVGGQHQLQKDEEAYLASNETCLLFNKDDKGAELKLKEVTYYYPPMK